MITVMNPYLLAGLAATSLPVLIHFLTRPRTRTIHFPAFHLLVEAGSGRQALNRLRTWLVLLLRVLAVAAIVLWFCRPYFKAPGSDLRPGDARRAVLIIDASLSMQGVDGGIPLFTKARAQAADVLRGLEDGSQAAIIFVGAAPKTVLPALSRNLSALHEALFKAEPSQEGGDAVAAIGKAQQMLGGQGAVYIFSDFQRSNWGRVDFSSCKGLNLFLRPVSEKSIGNAGITAVETSPGTPVVNESVELKCKIFNANPEKRIETVRLDLEGISESQDIELQPFSSGTAKFSFSLARRGNIPGKVSIGRDNLPGDNTRYFRLQVREKIRILVVSDTDKTNHTAPASLVAKALCPFREDRTGLQVSSSISQDVGQAALAESDVFVLVSPVQLSGEAVNALAERVRNGASLLCLLGGPSAEPLMSALAGASEGDIRPPFQLKKLLRTNRTEGEEWSTIKTHRGPLEIFHSPEQGEFSGLYFREHWLTEDISARKNEILARYADGSAALAVSPAGLGMAVYGNFPISPNNSNIAGSPLFPALLHELLRSLRKEDISRGSHPGLTWYTSVTNAGKEEALTISGPNNTKAKATVLSRGRYTSLSITPVALPGHYAVQSGTKVLDIAAVNVDPRETDTRAVNVKELIDEEALAGTSVAVLDEAGSLVEAGRATDLWPRLALAACLLLGTEMLILSLWQNRQKKIITGGGKS